MHRARLCAAVRGLSKARADIYFQLDLRAIEGMFNFILNFFAVIILKHKLSSALAVAITLLLGGCMARPPSAMESRLAQVESQGLSAEQKRAIILLLLANQMPPTIEALKFWPLRNENFSREPWFEGLKDYRLEVEYAYMRTPRGVFAGLTSTAPYLQKICVVLIFAGEKIMRLTRPSYRNCSREGGEDLLPVFREIERERLGKALASKPASAPGRKL